LREREQGIGFHQGETNLLPAFGPAFPVGELVDPRKNLLSGRCGALPIVLRRYPCGTFEYAEEAAKHRLVQKPGQPVVWRWRIALQERGEQALRGFRERQPGDLVAVRLAARPPPLLGGLV